MGPGRLPVSGGRTLDAQHVQTLPTSWTCPACDGCLDPAEGGERVMVITRLFKPLTYRRHKPSKCRYGRG